MKNAFYYMFKDCEFLKKTYIVYIFILISTLVSNLANLIPQNPLTGTNWVAVGLAFVSAILIFIPQGYFLFVIKSLTMDEKESLPELSLKRDFVQGLKVSVAFGMLYFLMITLLSILLTISIVAGMTTGVKTYFYIVISVILFVLLLLAFYLPAFTWMFSFKDNFLTYFRYILATKMFCIDIKRYLLVLLVIAPIVIISAYILGTISSPRFLSEPLLFALVTIIDSIIMYYVMLVIAYLISKSIKTEAFELLGVYQYDNSSNNTETETKTDSDIQGYIEENKDEVNDNVTEENKEPQNENIIENNTEENPNENN